MCSRARVLAIYTAAEAGAPMQLRSEVLAVPGRGLEGDRYYNGNGAFSARDVPGREVTELTLIEAEVIGHLRYDLGIDVDPADTRRNLVTRGIALNELVGREFWVGDVRLFGAGLCEPCVSLVKSPAQVHLLRGLAHKGGLRARIASGGAIRVGEPVVAMPVVIEDATDATAPRHPAVTADERMDNQVVSALASL